MKKIIPALFMLVTFSALLIAQEADKQVQDSLSLKESTADDNKSGELPPGFTSDGCTWFPDGNYRECCEAHDLDYYKGGSFKERRASDKRLYRCVKSKPGWKNKFRAPMMYFGVRAFGPSFLPTPFRWGFGRKKIKKALEAAEADKAKENNAPVDTKKDVSN